MSYGVRVNIEHFTDASNFLEAKNIEHSIWNAEDVFFGDASYVDFEFQNEQSRDTLSEFVQELKSSKKSLSR